MTSFSSRSRNRSRRTRQWSPTPPTNIRGHSRQPPLVARLRNLSFDPSLYPTLYPSLDPSLILAQVHFQTPPAHPPPPPPPPPLTREISFSPEGVAPADYVDQRQDIATVGLPDAASELGPAENAGHGLPAVLPDSLLRDLEAVLSLGDCRDRATVPAEAGEAALEAWAAEQGRRARERDGSGSSLWEEASRTSRSSQQGHLSRQGSIKDQPSRQGSQKSLVSRQGSQKGQMVPQQPPPPPPPPPADRAAPGPSVQARRPFFSSGPHQRAPPHLPPPYGSPHTHHHARPAPPAPPDRPRSSPVAPGHAWSGSGAGAMLGAHAGMPSGGPLGVPLSGGFVTAGLGQLAAQVGMPAGGAAALQALLQAHGPGGVGQVLGRGVGEPQMPVLGGAPAVGFQEQGLQGQLGERYWRN